jgi:hypothetical protein
MLPILYETTVKRAGGKNFHVDLPKWIVVGLGWSSPNVTQKKLPDLPIKLIVIPETGEVIIKHKEVKPTDTGQFIINAMTTPRTNPIKKIINQDNKKFNQDIWKDNEKDYVENIQTKVNAKQELLQVYQTRKKELKNQLLQLEDAEKEISQEISKMPKTKKELKKLWEVEKWRREQLQAVHLDPNRRYEIKEKKYKKQPIASKTKATKSGNAQ